MVWSRTQDSLFCQNGLCPGELTQIKIDFMFEFTIISHWRRLFKIFLFKSNGYFHCCILFKLCLLPESFAIWIDWQRIFIFIPIDQRYNAAAHLHDHCVVSLISYPVRSIKYDTKLIVGVISINIRAQFALIHQKMNGQITETESCDAWKTGLSDERIEKFLMDEAKANSESVPLLESLSFSSEQHPVSRAATFSTAAV